MNFIQHDFYRINGQEHLVSVRVNNGGLRFRVTIAHDANYPRLSRGTCEVFDVDRYRWNEVIATHGGENLFSPDLARHANMEMAADALVDMAINLITAAPN